MFQSSNFLPDDKNLQFTMRLCENNPPLSLSEFTKNLCNALDVL